MEGDTYLFGLINPAYILSNEWTPDNAYAVVLKNQNNAFDGDRFMAGAIDQMHFVEKIVLVFYDSGNNILRDDNDNNLELVGRPEDLGHIFDSIPRDLVYSYMKFLFHPKGDVRFDPAKLFFHCAKRPPPPKSTTDANDESREMEDDPEELQGIFNNTEAIEILMNRTMNETAESADLEDIDCRLSALAQQHSGRRRHGHRQQVRCSLDSSEERGAGIGKWYSIITFVCRTHQTFARQ